MQIINAADRGLIAGPTGNAIDNREIIQEIMDELAAPNQFTLVQFPPGDILVAGTVFYHLSQDAPVRVEIRGAGRDITRFHQTVAQNAIFDVKTTVNHVHAFSMRDFSTFHGGLKFERVGGESVIENVAVTHTNTEPAAIVVGSGCTGLQFRDIYIVHSGGTSTYPESIAIQCAPNTETVWHNLRTGEDVGGIQIDGGFHRFLGCDCESGRKSGDWVGMGQAVFDVGIAGRLMIENSTIKCLAGRRLANMYWANSLDVRGCFINSDQTHLVNVNTGSGPARGCRFLLVGNRTDMPNLTDFTIGETPASSVVAGNDCN